MSIPQQAALQGDLDLFTLSLVPPRALPGTERNKSATPELQPSVASVLGVSWKGIWHLAEEALALQNNTGEMKLERLHSNHFRLEANTTLHF